MALQDVERLNYPASLEKHKKAETFNLDDKRFRLRSSLAYFHDNEIPIYEFPLYMHTHDFYELNIIVRGYGRHYIEDKNFPAMPGDVFAIPPNIWHGYWAKDNSMSIFHLLISREMFLKYEKDAKNFPGFYLLFETEPQIRKNIESVAFFLRLGEQKLQEFLPEMQKLTGIAAMTFSGHEMMFETYAMGLIYELSYLIGQEFQTENETKKQNNLKPVVNTTNFMLQNLDRYFSIDELAQISMQSRTGYIEHFKKLFGMTPFEYLKKLRIDRAIELLRTTGNSVSSIAQSCGFSDSSHLIRVFKEMTGTTPTKFRKEEKNKFPPL